VEFTERTDLTLVRILERQCCLAHKPGPKIPYRLELTRSLETRATRTFLLIALNVSPHWPCPRLVDTGLSGEVKIRGLG
jgi:hypothetical protein